MQMFDFVIEHIPGKDNSIADCFSGCCSVTQVSPIAAAHNGIVGHHGKHRTLEILAHRGQSWPSMAKEVESFIAQCPTCQKVRLGRASLAAALKTTAVYEPWEVLAVDTVGPLPKDSFGNKFLIVFVDCFTRFTEIFPTKTASAMEAATALLNLVGRYGAPRLLRSDRGTQFLADLISQLLSFLKMDRQLTLAYRPQTTFHP